MNVRHSLFALALAFVLSADSVFAGASDACGVPVFVHNCNWHEKLGNRSSWHSATVLPLYSDGFCVPDPRAPEGFDCFTGYRSLDRATVEYHNALMLANCLVPLTSWWDRVGEHNEASGDLFLDLFISVPSPMQTGILYEVVGRLKETQIGNLPDGRPHKVYDFGNDATSENAQRFISDVRYLNEKYLQRHPERFYTIDGRPVLFIWLSHAFHGRFDLAVAELRKTVPVYIIGSDFGVRGAPGTDRTQAVLNTVRGLDAVSAYGIFDGELATKYGGHLSREYVDLYVISVLNWNVWLREHAPQVKLILPTQFTYNDRKSPLMDKTTPEEARYLVQMARALIDQGREGCTNVLPAVLHVSLNEAFEGTSIEPTDRYKDSFLKLFPEVFGPPLAPAPACPVR